MESRQNPQCEGVNQNRILFSAKAADRHRSLYYILSCIPHQVLGEYRSKADSDYNISNRAGSVLSPDEICASTPSSLSDCETAAIVGGIPFALSCPGGTEEETNIEKNSN